MPDPLLSAESVAVRYKGMPRPALDGVSLRIDTGINLGIVGESGSGKSTLARCLLGIETLSGGRVLYGGRELAAFSRDERRRFHRQVQMVFQDPLNSLNPRMTIGTILGEVLNVHARSPRAGVQARVEGILDRVGLPAAVMTRYPHELSGGQRQRTGIARALLLEPSVLIADEPVSALDVSVQAQILNLLTDLAGDTGITLVLIAHDLAVVRYVCQRIAVMRSGTIVEQGDADTVIGSPRHPYTRNLLAAVPDIDRIAGTVAS